MRCPACGSMKDQVVDSRMSKDGENVRRRRACLDCGYRFTTYESVVPDELKVVKRNGERVEFNRDRLRRGVVNACYKRAIPDEEIDRLVDEVTTSLLRDFEKEVQTSEIGRRVMAKLKILDPVAYVRFASVYLKFKAVEEFDEVIDEMRGEK